ncbi:hypothetical protein Tco_0776694 [Tanacetum coccineum]
MIDQGVTVVLAARDANRSTNGDDSHNSRTSVRRTEQATREFENQVRFATCTLHSVALTWWNTHVKTIGYDAAYDQETGNEDLGFDGEGYRLDKLYPTLSGIGFVMREDVSRRI